MITTLSLQDFDYPLPEALIARYPLENRADSRMLTLDRHSQTWRHDRFESLVEYLNPGDLVVLNNTKVLPVRIACVRPGHTGKVELFLLTPQNSDKTQWLVLMRPARRLKPGTLVQSLRPGLTATLLESLPAGQGLVDLQWPPETSFDTMLQQVGEMPIPPYLGRPAEQIDVERYQTVFAQVPGAQAAPTAGLHFTPEHLGKLRQQGIQVAEITLHVSAGTFRPILSEDVSSHRMDPEWYDIPEPVAVSVAKTKALGNRVVAIGTTVAKTLESAVLKNGGTLHGGSDWSNLFITPGFRFQTVDVLLTNFHLPKSTLLLLVSAFASKELILNAYHSALQERYRFFSYGDCMLIL